MERECLAAADAASPVDRLVLCEAARLADKLGFALEAGGIDASQEQSWGEHAEALVGLLELVGSAMPTSWIVNSVSAFAAKIGTPRTGI